MNDTQGKELLPDIQDAVNRTRHVMFSDELGMTEASSSNSNNLFPEEKAVAEERRLPPNKEVIDTAKSHHYQKNNKNRNQNNNRNSGPHSNTTPAAPAPIGEVIAHSPTPTSSPPSALGKPEDLEKKPEDLERKPEDLERKPEDLEKKPEDLERKPEDLERRPEGRGSRRQRLRRPVAPHVLPPELLEEDPAEEARKALQEAAALLEAQERAERVRVEAQQQEAQSRMYSEMRAAWMKQKAKVNSPQTHHPNGENNKDKNNGGNPSDVHVKVDPNVQHLQRKSETEQCSLPADDARTEKAISLPPPSEAATKQEKEGQPKGPSENNIIQWALRLLSRLPGDGIVWKVVMLLAALLCSRRLLLLLQR